MMLVLCPERRLAIADMLFIAGLWLEQCCVLSRYIKASMKWRKACVASRCISRKVQPEQTTGVPQWLWIFSSRSVGTVVTTQKPDNAAERLSNYVMTSLGTTTSVPYQLPRLFRNPMGSVKIRRCGRDEQGSSMDEFSQTWIHRHWTASPISRVFTDYAANMQRLKRSTKAF